MNYINLGCGPTSAPLPWINVDIVEDENIKPDILISSGRPEELVEKFGYEFDSIDKIYLGHILEHINWPDLYDFMLGCKKLLKKGGQICVVGPDTFKTLDMWKNNIVDFNFVRGVIEDDLNYQVSRNDWSGASHKWNYYLERAVRLIQGCGFNNIETPEFNEQNFSEWPVWSYTNHQTGIIASK